MAGRCEMCGKQAASGHNVSHSKRRTKRRFEPNLQRTTIQVAGVPLKVRICTRCLRTLQKKGL